MISGKDYPVLHKLVKDYISGRLGPGPDNTRRRRPSGGGGGEAKKYATVKRSLQRPDPTATPPVAAISCYKVKLASEEEFDAWSPTHGVYGVATKVLWTDGLDYECIVEHTSASGKSPANESYWECASLDAYILGYPYTDLIGTVPWLKVEAEVEVVLRDGKYYIHATVSRCEEENSDGELFTSIQWNTTEWRQMAVYK